MSFKAFTQDLEIRAIGKTASQVKDLFQAYNIHVEEEDYNEDDEILMIEPIVEMTYDDSNDFNSDHDIAKRQLDELEGQNGKFDTTSEVRHSSNNTRENGYRRKTKGNAPTSNLDIDEEIEYHDDGLESYEKEDDGSDGSGAHTCDLCGAAFRVKHSITKHKRVVHGMHQFSCMFCQESYPLKRNLLDHILTHRGPHGFKCEICNKVRPNYISIQRHIKTHAEKSIPCGQCSAWFKTKWELRSHEIQHQKERNFECCMCKMSFVNPTKLRLHMTRHSGYRPYACDICGKDFTAQGNLTNHRKLHFEAKPFKCQYCSLTFLSSAARKKHIPLHDRERKKPYECEDCKKQYTSTTSLAVHRLKFHSGSRVYDCYFCKQKFVSKREIELHVAQHTVERPHSCRMCPCRYKNRRELRRHQREKNHYDEGDENESEEECGENWTEPEVYVSEDNSTAGSYSLPSQ